MIVVRTNDHDLTSKIRISAFDKTQHILSLESSSFDVDRDCGLELTLRRSEVGNEISCSEGRSHDDWDLRISGAVNDAHGSQSGWQIISKSLGENHNTIAIDVGRILGDVHTDCTIVFQSA